MSCLRPLISLPHQRFVPPRKLGIEAPQLVNVHHDALLSLVDHFLNCVRVLVVAMLELSRIHYEIHGPRRWQSITNFPSYILVQKLLEQVKTCAHGFAHVLGGRGRHGDECGNKTLANNSK